MILSSFKIYTKSISLNPQHVTIYIDLNSAIESIWSFIINKDLKVHHMDLEEGKAETNQSRLGKKVLHEFKHKAKTHSNTW
jgi:hypothetical protein